MSVQSWSKSLSPPTHFTEPLKGRWSTLQNTKSRGSSSDPTPPTLHIPKVGVCKAASICTCICIFYFFLGWGEYLYLSNTKFSSNSSNSVHTSLPSLHCYKKKYSNKLIVVYCFNLITSFAIVHCLKEDIEYTLSFSDFHIPLFYTEHWLV